jgi:SAM-dependent methyltransferase
VARNTDDDWKRVATEDPYWGVLSEDDYHAGTMNDARFAQFMETGERFVGDIFGLIHAHILPDFAPKSALDFGCGVGRLLIPIARRVQRAVGIDVAPAMLDLAKRHAKEAGLSNVTLRASDDGLSGIDGPFDLVNTYIVLQHIPPERGYRLMHELLERVAIGGIASIQVTYAKARSFLVHETPRALYYRRDGDRIVDLVDSGWRPPAGTITMYDYDLNEVMAQCTRYAGHPIIALPTDNAAHLGLHLVFQRAR